MSLKYNFTLKDINHTSVIERYSLYLTDAGNSKINVTKISDLDINKPKETISFLDEIKNTKKCVVSMFDSIKSEFLSDSTEISCFWCRHSFETPPIGCPLKYIPSQYEKKYYSEITKDNYVIRQNITPTKKEEIKDTGNLITRDYYETDGIFCSFNCCISFIEDNKHKSMYEHSSFLLKKIYFELSGDYTEIVPAPDWRLLKEYGGILTITDFRKSFNVNTYILFDKIRELPRFKSIGWVYEDKTD
jgi:hypothetical protein